MQWSEAGPFGVLRNEPNGGGGMIPVQDSEALDQPQVLGFDLS